MEKEEKLSGVFTKVIYRSNNYMVSLFKCEEGTITVTGPSFDIDEKSKYVLSGEYTHHPKYGFQFKINSIEKSIPSTADEIIEFLSSPLFKSIGKKTAKKIYNSLGDNALNLLREDISIVNTLNLTPNQREGLIEGFESIKDEDSDGLFELLSLGFSNNDCMQIINKFKDKTKEVLKDNPLKFYLDVYGISFQKVIDCTQNLVFDDKNAKYAQALLIDIFKNISFNLGDTYLYLEDFKPYYLKYRQDFDEALDRAIKDEYLILDDNRYYLSYEYYDEVNIARTIKTLNSDTEVNLEDLNILIDQNAKSSGIEYDDDQKKAIENFFVNDFSLIIGGPGTGKTTLIKALVDIYKECYPFNEIIVVAPTGRAAKRINEICDVESKTIHSLLRWNKEVNTFVFNEDNLLTYDAVIIDESSMVDNFLFSAFLKASKNVTKLCLIGDNNQLPSIRQGNLLADLIDSNQFVISYLNTIHRQSFGNEIIDLSRAIIDENINFNNYHQDIDFININDFSHEILINMVSDLFNQGVSFDDIEILSPMYRGQYGIDNLNQSLQKAFNPEDESKNQKQVGKLIFREYDKILQLKNRPDDDVYNGDIGILEDIDNEEHNILIKFGDVFLYLNFDELNMISLAYAMSVHKAQGSEYPYVFLFVGKEHFHMLDKKLIYTAVSRAKKHLYIISDQNVFNAAVKRQSRKRKTYLRQRLKLEY